MSNFWKEIWDSKGNGSNNDLLFLDGYEHLKIEADSKIISDGILKSLGVGLGQSILEVGCGAGFLGREMNSNYEYFGVDYSEPLIDKHKFLFPEHNVSCAEGDNLPFPDDNFDYVFCFGVYQYLPSEEYAISMIEEMKRVSSKGIFLGDLKEKATREQHLPCPRDSMEELGFSISKPFYDIDDCYRYNAYFIMENKL